MTIGALLTTLCGAIVWLTKAILARDDQRIEELRYLASRGTEIADKAIQHADTIRKP